MFEGVLYFVLGFLAAALLALMVSPAIWNRAVTLTRRRIESSVPLTLNEVQADKDQLRAEFAMSTRRLELSIEELRDKAARQVIEINRKRDELAKLSEESREELNAMNELEGYGNEIRQKLSDREKELENTNRALQETREKLELSTIELERVHRKLDEASLDADSRRIELVAKQTSLDDLATQYEHLKSERDRLEEANRRLEGTLRTGNQKQDAADEQVSRLQKTVADLEEKLRRRERDVANMPAASQAKDVTDNELTRLLMDEQAKTNELEAKLAIATLRTESLLADASNENVEKAMQQIAAEKDELLGRIDALTKERDSLKEIVNAGADLTAAEWDRERKENAILRERINDLAAQVTAMTAAIDGPNSPINEIIAETEAAGREDTTGTSLADRVRAIQEKAKVKQA